MNPLKRLFTFIKPYRGRLFGSVFFSILYTFSRASQPFFIGLAISQLARDMKAGTGVNFKYIGIIILLLIITSVIDAVGDYLSSFLLADVVQNTMGDIRTNINHKINHLPVLYFDSRQQGEILSRITTDVDVVSVAMQQGTLRVVSAILTIVFSLGFMFFLSPFFTLIAMIMFPLCIFIYRVFLKKTQPIFVDLQNVLGDLNGYTTEYYTGYEVVQLFGQENGVSEKFEKITEDLNKIGFKSNFSASTINPILSWITHMFYIGLFLMLALTVLNGPFIVGGFVLAAAMEIGGLQSFIQYVWQASGPIRDITQLSNTFQAAAASLTRVFQLLDEKEEIPDKEPHTMDLESVKGDVSFNHISFGYSRNNLLMKDINVNVKNGEMVAIVGPTGAGKTTLINLLMRFYSVTGGAITVDGVDLYDFTRNQSRSLFGMVLQDPWLYYASMADNIRFGKLDATLEEIVAAAEVANVDHYIRTLPDGYDTMLNEESSNISQGQKQLLTIARALIGDPKILILDEATSSVDTRLEQLIQTAMAKAMENRTSFIIAHRLSTIRNADLILVMNQGSIVEQGTHEGLLEQGGMYKELYESQFSEEAE